MCNTLSVAQVKKPVKTLPPAGKAKGPVTQTFEPPVFDPEECTFEQEAEYAGKWLFRSATTASGKLLKTYWLGRNFNPNGLIGPDPIPPVENNYVGINTAEPTSVLDVHIPENLNANPLYGLTVSTGSQCSKVGLVAGDHQPSWVGSYSYGENGTFPFQVRAGNFDGYWNPATGTFIHLNPSNSRIGINTNTPQATLDVNGDAKADNLKLTQVPEGLVGINSNGFISPATTAQVTNLLVTNGEQNYIPKFGQGNMLENSYIKQGILASGSSSVAFKYDEPDLKSHFHFGNLQTLHVDGGNSQFAYNSYSFKVAQNAWVNPKLDGNLGASRIIQFSNGQIGFWNLKSNENSSQWKSVLTLTPDRWVGIGTENPSAKLEIKAADQEAAKIALNAGTDQAKGIEFQDNGTTKWQIAKAANSEDLVIGDGSLENSIRIVKNENIIGQTPRVVIGEKTISLANSNQFGGNKIKLSVDGVGVFKEIAVLEPGQWADYVFDKDYKLLSLDSVETFVNQNHHLPDVPSACEVSQNGLKVGEMNAVLLRKIEELTLYIIDLKKEVETLKSKKP